MLRSFMNALDLLSIIAEADRPIGSVGKTNNAILLENCLNKDSKMVVNAFYALYGAPPFQVSNDYSYCTTAEYLTFRGYLLKAVSDKNFRSSPIPGVGPSLNEIFGYSRLTPMSKKNMLRYNLVYRQNTFGLLSWTDFEWWVAMFGCTATEGRVQCGPWQFAENVMHTLVIASLFILAGWILAVYFLAKLLPLCELTKFVSRSLVSDLVAKGWTRQQLEPLTRWQKARALCDSNGKGGSGGPSMDSKTVQDLLMALLEAYLRAKAGRRNGHRSVAQEFADTLSTSVNSVSAPKVALEGSGFRYSLSIGAPLSRSLFAPATCPWIDDVNKGLPDTVTLPTLGEQNPIKTVARLALMAAFRYFAPPFIKIPVMLVMGPGGTFSSSKLVAFSATDIKKLLSEATAAREFKPFMSVPDLSSSIQTKFGLSGVE